MQPGLIVKKSFSDKMSWDSTEKTAVSVRDGALEYYGAELGLSPENRVFKVYRSPATIANVARVMEGIPVTDEHIDMSKDVTNKMGVVNQSEMIDLVDEVYNSKLAIRNKLSIDDIALLDELGNRELSLGYTADLVPCEDYDFEQKNIVPHHLAIVESGRCGSSCSFLDKKEVTRMAKNMFMDEDGEVNLEDIVKLIQDFAEAAKKVPTEKLLEVVPMLREVVDLAKGDEGEADDVIVEESAEGEEGASIVEEKLEDESGDDEIVEKVEVTDSAQFKDAVKSAVKDHTVVIEKATEFLDASYTFVGKDTKQIMRDALKTQYGREKFEDKDLPLCFKMLKQVAGKETIFEDAERNVLEELGNKDL